MRSFFYTKVRPRLKRLARAIGIQPKRARAVKQLPEDFDEQSIRIFNAINPFTMTSPERVYSLISAVRYIVAHGIDGDVVECGVWRGGSMMAVALMLKELGDTGRNLYLYDTYEGMSAPTAEDGPVAEKKFTERQLSEDTSEWCRSPIDEVRDNLASTGYPPDRIHFIKGKVEDTIPAEMPAGSIALLRLDTDWYESTRHELIHLYPRLVSKGVLIIDDYGAWEGARRAVDEYLAEYSVPLLLNRIDVTARIAVKP